MSSPTPDDRRWLDAAARQAMPYLGTTAEHPTAAAIIVDTMTRKLLGRAITAPGGRPGAATLAVGEAGEAARGATLYLTIEPALGSADLDAILGAGLARIVIGIADPDPRTAGQGLERFRATGIELIVADQPSARRLHVGHVARTTRGMPFVTARLAVSADGKVGRRGSGVTIAGDAGRRFAQMLRATNNAVMTGWGTLLSDDLLLKVEVEGLEVRKPLRVIFAGLKTYDLPMRLLTRTPDGPVVVIATPEKKLELPAGIEIIRVNGLKGRPDPRPAFATLAAKGVQHLLVEAGPTLLESLLAARLIDRFHLLLRETVVGPDGILATARGQMEARLVAGGFSLVDHRLLGADNLRTFERLF